jgi:hypothetical protein
MGKFAEVSSGLGLGEITMSGATLVVSSARHATLLGARWKYR